MTMPNFVGNPLSSREDLVNAAAALVLPLKQYRSATGARVKLRPATVAAFDDVAAQLEGFARPLLAIGAFLDESEDNDDMLRRLMKGLAAGVDPKNEEYWGNMGDYDQRMVETESICIALLSAPDRLLPFLDAVSKDNLALWLKQINRRDMPANNWRWFRVFVNLTLTQVLGQGDEEPNSVLASDFAVLDSFYVCDGWSSDGIWGEERRQADYYSGSFAMQFSALLYVRFASGDEERKSRYVQHAKQFGGQYWRYFDVQGAAIPFGRSQTYRFAFAAFWAASALAGVDLPPPVHNLGSVKGLLLRHLRWWSSKTDMFNADGTLNIGFAYPNMYLSEDYNSPQSVYWCLKVFVILLLPESHAFWRCEEKGHPMTVAEQPRPDIHGIFRAPRQLVVNAEEHHYLLSAGQMTTKPHKAREAKYCKFAYSSAFGFSVPTGSMLHQMAPDSTLCISLDGGESWVSRNAPSEGVFGHATVNGTDRIPTLTSVWKPSRRLDLEIETILVPLASHFPGWHVRIHKLARTADSEAALFRDGNLVLVDGGFAVPAFTDAGLHITETTERDVGNGGCFSRGESHCLVRSSGGTGGVAVLENNVSRQQQQGGTVHATHIAEPMLLRADPNTNLISPRTFIPCVKYTLDAAGLKGNGKREAQFVTGVFAVDGSKKRHQDVTAEWENRPQVFFTKDGSHDIVFQDAKLRG